MYDVCVVGAGPAGLGAGMYAGRLNLRTLIVGEEAGGLIATTTLVENYPGFVSIPGGKLAERLLEHAKHYGVELIEERVEEIRQNCNVFEVLTSSGSRYEAKSVILATGTVHRKLPAKNAEKFEGRGVYYCALCDAPLFRDRKVAVVGGGDGAAKEALLLAEYAEKVYILCRDEGLHAEPPNLRKIEENPRIEIINHTNVVEILGEERVSGVLMQRQGREERLEVEGVFVAIGGIPRSELARRLGVEVNEKGEVVTDKQARTNLAGVFAAGDVTAGGFRQAIISVAEGVTAAYSAYRYLTSEYVETRRCNGEP
ncbi:MAG: FAD-dependent oxidoreductase [Euryarchaeota archaeon]|nr:FAD-dependent oxidoreductase [Euryarchaeota archaeon]